jgi:hypothetical protein
MQNRVRFVVAPLLAAACLQPAHAVDSQLQEPALPLPNPLGDEVAIHDWDDDRPLSNSGRAWHYNRNLVQPLMEVSDAVNDSTLTCATRMMLVTVVASRTGCMY